MIKYVVIAVTLAFGMSVTALAGGAPSVTGSTVYFVNLNDGDKVKAPFKVIFGLSGMGVAPAGIEKAKTGHHHLFVDRPALGKGKEAANELKANIPADKQHRHFGGGQTETMLDLAPGKHTLQLVLGDKDHIPHSPPVISSVITVIVE